MAVARRSAHITIMVEAAEKAGRALVRDFGEIENLQVSKKGPGNFVSTADHKSEKIIRDILQKGRPKYGLLMEESGLIKGEDKGWRWIVDPLDGTMNFLHGIPHWCVAIALEKDSEIVAGVIYDPIKDEMFWTEKGLGAYVNNRRLQVAGRNALTDCALSIAPKSLGQVDGLDGLMQSGLLTRCMGCTCLDLAYVAAGRLDGIFKARITGGLWDVAAGILMVREARGIATDAKGGKDLGTGGSLLAANASLHKDLLQKIKPAPQKDTKVKSAS